MYPLSDLKFQSDSEGASGSGGGEGMLQDVNKQRGAFVEVKGWGDVLEGASRREFPPQQPSDQAQADLAGRNIACGAVML